ncbi:hypothetical protein BCR34DRAFT_24168 [Clohesyomyces aquaticus]|uniref:Uncharacterized protein n=1 Tax=Clohesyomyces aquaticus TaxID=1231657 RepID=A0A1Y2A6K2_9PLEO|nr:hypothetical protein BCR34DRAFT_24168 [Clohesyomyces aquaticus]
MQFLSIFAIVAGLTAPIQCTLCGPPLQIDNFSRWSSNTNSLNDWTSDDGTMSTISASNNLLLFKPSSSGSYFYESFPCQTASTNGYNAVSFVIKGPSGGSLILEIASSVCCSANAQLSKNVQVIGLSGVTQTVIVPFSSAIGANPNAVRELTWSGFSTLNTVWQLSNISFVCIPSSVIV